MTTSRGFSREVLKRGFKVNSKMNIEGTIVGDTTALFLAAHGGWNDIVRLLLESSADADKEDSSGATSLYIASQNGHLKVVKCLVEVWKAEVDKERNIGATPLFMASQYGKLEVVEWLVEEGKANKDGWTSLMALRLKRDF